jgi:DNA-binding SARP family transcriptional activator/Tfp pilus assembly protein PilF
LNPLVGSDLMDLGRLTRGGGREKVLTVEIRLLGTFEVRSAGRSVDLGPAKQRILLAALAVEAGKPVPADALIDRIWDECAPREARGALHTYVARTRRVLAQATDHGRTWISIRRRMGGYELAVDRDLIDLHRFRRLTGQARLLDLNDPRRSALLSEAVGLWQSEALGSLPGAWATRTREGLAEQRLSALVDWAEGELALGHYHVVLERLENLVIEYPLSESLVGRLVQALRMAGRTAEALGLYAKARQRISDELGVEPGPELRALHQALLRGEPVGDRAATPARAALHPAQLPMDVHGFAGRGEQLARLDELLAGAAQAPATAVISALSGTAGVGKTALVVHWAHRVADRFPDGQLYVNLRAFDAGGRVMTPAEAIRGFLDALGVPPERIPPDIDAQAALYRSLLAGKRILVVLDNARDAEQARPLLPGTHTAFAVVTSRDQLTPMVAADGAQPLTLDLLTPGEARTLLDLRLGTGRVAAEPAAVEEIIAACARLPLALSIAAARAQQTNFPLATLAGELTSAGQRLDTLDAGDPASEVRAVFSWSYATLKPPAARLFRLLGLHPGPGVSIAAAASLAGHGLAKTRQLLTELARANLLTEHLPGRYTFHDLLRIYATDLADAHDADRTRRAAVTRVLDHYTHTAHAADRLLHAARDPIPVPLATPASDTTPEDLADYAQAMAWLTAEHRVLLAVHRRAADTGFDTHTWQLAWVLDTFLDRQGHWHDLAAAWQAALHAAGRLADPAVRAAAGALAHRFLAHAETRRSHYAAAHSHYRQALELDVRAGDRLGQAHTHGNLAILWERQDSPKQALDHAEQALSLFQAVGDRRGQALALNMVGWYHAQLGGHTEALAYCEQALALQRQLGDRYGEAHTWDSLGYAHHAAGDHAAADDCYQHAQTLFRDLGDRYNQAEVLTRLGDSYQAAGDPTGARNVWSDALRILTELDHPDANAVRVKLDNLVHN